VLCCKQNRPVIPVAWLVLGKFSAGQDAIISAEEAAGRTSFELNRTYLERAKWKEKESGQALA
jgi:hypothetical protein